MSLALVLILQAAAAPRLALPEPAPPPARPPTPVPLVAPIDFDLGRYGPDGPGWGGRGCVGGDPGAITVCGRRRSGAGYPLEEMARLFEPGPLIAETGLIGNARARAYVESVEFPGGLVSNRVMIGIKLPF